MLDDMMISLEEEVLLSFIYSSRVADMVGPLEAGNEDD